MSSFTSATGTSLTIPVNSLFVRFTPVTGGFNFVSYFNNSSSNTY